MFNAINNCTACASINLWNTAYQLDATSDVKVLGTYGYNLIQSLIPEPNGYHVEYVLCCQGFTSVDGVIRANINNIATNWISTWSVQSFRNVQCSPAFKISDIILEPTVNYENKLGTNLHIEFSGNGSGVITNVSITAFLVKD